MTHSLYPKFILGYPILGLMGFIAIAAFSSKMIRDYLVQSKADALYDEADSITSPCSIMYQGKRSDSEEVSTQIRALPHCLRTEIWVINRQGTMVVDSLGGSRVQSLIDGFDPASIGNRSCAIGDYCGTFDRNVLSVSIPITGNYNAYGYMLIHLPISEVDQSQSGILGILYITSVILFDLSLIILLIFTWTVYLPLRKITMGTNEYAAGDLDYRINVKIHGEMGCLSDTLNYMSDEPNKMEEYQKNLIADISHGLHSPLASIKGYLEAILDDAIPAEMYEKYLSRAISETERLHRLAENMLTLNSLGTKGYLSRTSFDISRVIKDTATSFEGTCRSKNVSFDLTFSDDIQMAFADLEKIQQVMYNLIDSTIKFNHHDSTIYIQASGRYERIFVSVKDTDIGIPKDNLKEIWERFYKTDLSRGKDKKGTGLGLSIVREIIQAHGENIDVISTEGVGTEFIFPLPRSTSLQIIPARPDYPRYQECLSI